MHLIPPGITKDNSADRSSADTKLFSKLLVCQRATKRPDFVDLLPRQLRSSPSVNIDDVRDRFQMIRINTGTDAAKMIQFHALRDRTKAVNPIRSMGSGRFPIAPHMAIPIFVRAPLPNPARRLVAAVFDEIGNRRKVVLVARKIAERLAFHDLQVKARSGSKGRGLATTAQAEPRRVRIEGRLSRQFMAMFQQRGIAGPTSYRGVVLQGLAAIKTRGRRTLPASNVVARPTAFCIPSLDFGSTVEAGSARLLAHRLVLSTGAMPRSVCALPGSFVARIIPYFRPWTGYEQPIAGHADPEDPAMLVGVQPNGSFCHSGICT